MMIANIFKHSFVTLALGIGSIGMNTAQAAYPERAVRVIVAYPAGGAVDPPARLLAKHLSDKLGQQFYVDNKPGAGGNIGTDLALSSPPDGYTLTLTGPNVTIAPALMPTTTKFDPNESFAHIARFMTIPSALVVKSDSPFKNLEQFIAFARENPGKLTYASPGNGSPSQLAMELFLRDAGIQVLHIPYKGTAPAVVDLLGGQVDLLISTISGPIEHVKSGAMRALGVTSAKRDQQLPDVPAIGETLPNFEVVSWSGYAAPAGTPPDIVKQLADNIREISETAEFQQALRTMGATPDYLGPEALSTAISKEADFYGQVIRDSKLAIN